MSESESENEAEDQPQAQGTRKTFFELLKEFPVLLNKSQIPGVKNAKMKATEALRTLFEQTTGKQCSSAQLSKMIHNLKQFMKKKTDLNKTGNKKIKLMDWELEFLDLLGSDNNPTFSRVPGGSSVGVKRSASNEPGMELVVRTSTNRSINGPSTSYENNETDIPPPPPKKGKLVSNLLDKAETEETKNITTTQLHPLVLLEHYKLLKMKQERFLNEQITVIPSHFSEHVKHQTVD